MSGTSILCQPRIPICHIQLQSRKLFRSTTRPVPGPCRSAKWGRLPNMVRHPILWSGAGSVTALIGCDRDCDGLSPTCVQARIIQGRADEGLEARQNGSIICMPSNAWNQTARATCAQSASTASEAPTADTTLSSTATGLGGPNTNVSASSNHSSQFSTNMSSPTSVFSPQPNPATTDLRTDASGTWPTSSTVLNTDTQISTKASDQLGASTENSILGFPGVSSATRRLTIPNFSSTVLTLTRTVTTLLTTTVPSSARNQG